MTATTDEPTLEEKVEAIAKYWGVEVSEINGDEDFINFYFPNGKSTYHKLMETGVEVS